MGGGHWDGIQGDRWICTTDIWYDHTEGAGEKQTKTAKWAYLYAWKAVFWLETVKLKTKGSIYTHCTLISKFCFDEDMV